MGKKWSKIKYISNWHSYYELEGKRLRDKDEIEIKWPNDTVTKHRVEIEREEYRGRGGMDESSSWDNAFIEVFAHDMEIRVCIDTDLMTTTKARRC